MVPSKLLSPSSSTKRATTCSTTIRAPLSPRASNAAAPGANLSDADMNALISQCAFDSVAHERASAFCTLFAKHDFEGFDHIGDLGKYYGTGYGQALDPVQGVGYVNELIARLTGTPVRDNTQTNRTIDADPTSFPLGRAFYAEFSHDGADEKLPDSNADEEPAPKLKATCRKKASGAPVAVHKPSVGR